MDYCDCGEPMTLNRTYRTTPDYPHYLYEFHCRKHGYMVFDNNGNFIRMGRIDDHGDDSHITGGRWI